MIKPKESVLKMEDYIPPLFKREESIRLDFNENTFGCSSKVVQAIKNFDVNKISVYPDYAFIKEKLSGYVGVNDRQLLLSNGADESIKLIFDTYIEEGEEIIIPVPTFAMFKFYASIAQAKIKEIQYENDLTFPTKRVIDSITGDTKVVVLVNPNNPTGTIISRNEILEIIRVAKKNDAIVLIDEAYYEFYGNSSFDLIDDFDNVIVVRTFSKAFGLAGLRFGYVLSNENIIRFLIKVSSPYNVNSFSLIAVDAALDDLNFVNNYVYEILDNKNYVLEELNCLGIFTYPSNANFVLAYFGDDCERVCDLLRDKNILVRNRSSDVLLDGFIRITIGTRSQCNIFLDEVKKLFSRKLMLFDMDGVLVDVSNSYRTAAKLTAEFFTGEKITYEDIESYKKIPGYNNDWDLTEAIINDKGWLVEKNKIINKFQEFYLGEKFDGLINNETWMLDKGILEALYGKYRLGIVTGRPKIEAEFALKINGMESFFDIMITKDDVLEEKPRPEGIFKALDFFNENRAVYFGDTINDKIAASEAKIGFVLVENNINKILRRF